MKEQNKPPLNSFQSRLAGWLVGRARSLWDGLAGMRKWSVVSDSPAEASIISTELNQDYKLGGHLSGPL
jgi:hypothetical protein